LKRAHRHYLPRHGQQLGQTCQQIARPFVRRPLAHLMPGIVRFTQVTLAPGTHITRATDTIIQDIGGVLPP